jgi:arylsulfatase A-like enzyme
VNDPASKPDTEQDSSVRNVVAQSRAAALWRVGASISVTWLLLFAVSLVLDLVVPGTMWHDDSLSGAARLAMLAYAGKGLVPLAIVVGVCLSCAGRSASGKPPAQTVGVRLLRTLATVGLFAAFLFYAASWGSFAGAGTFLGTSGYGLVRVAPGQMAHYIADMAPPLVSLSVIAGAVCATIVVIRFIAPRIYRAAPSTCRRLSMLLIIMTESCLIAAGWGEVMFGQDTSPLPAGSAGLAGDVAQLYVADRDERTGPMAHLLARFDQWKEEEAIPNVRFTIAVDTPVVVSMKQYLGDSSASRMHRYNVVVLEVESLRSDQLKVDGGKRVVMPNVEAMAQGSRVYLDAITTATHSDYAAPVPLSGQYPLRSPVEYLYPPRPPYPRVLIYDILKQVRYHTGIMSSQNELWGGMYYFLNTGSVDHFLHSETFRGPTYLPRTDFGFAHFVAAYKRAGVIDDRYTVGEAIKWIDSLYARNRSREPFFMYMNLQSSHVPYQRPADFPPRFGSGRVSFAIGFGKFPPDSAAAVLDMYDNSLAYADAQIGRLIQHLQARGLWDSTIFVLTGDHGQAFYEHGFAAHANLPFSELVKVPLIIRAPGLAPGLDDRPAQHVDVAPTILALLGLPPHPAYQGISLTGPEPPPDRPLFTVAQSAIANGYSIIRGRYTLILDAAHKREMLFDDAEDPAQRKDLSAQLPAVRDSLRHELDMWREVQLEYYSRKAGQDREYAPRLRF